jgi:hypothetical protein
MRRLIAFALIGGAVTAMSATSCRTPAPAATRPVSAKSVAVVGVGAVDPALVSRVQTFVEENSALQTRLLPARELAGRTLDDEGAAVGKLVGDGVFCVVAIVEPVEDIKPHGVLLPDRSVAVVNGRSLRPADGDAEKYGRRLERETMQAIGMLLKLDPCPNPQCALWPYTTDEELDTKGRNYCPPCLEKVQKAARERGLQLIESSPFLVQ